MVVHSACSKPTTTWKEDFSNSSFTVEDTSEEQLVADRAAILQHHVWTPRHQPNDTKCGRTTTTTTTTITNRDSITRSIVTKPTVLRGQAAASSLSSSLSSSVQFDLSKTEHVVAYEDFYDGGAEYVDDDRWHTRDALNAFNQQARATATKLRRHRSWATWERIFRRASRSVVVVAASSTTASSSTTTTTTSTNNNNNNNTLPTTTTTAALAALSSSSSLSSHPGNPDLERVGEIYRQSGEDLIGVEPYVFSFFQPKAELVHSCSSSLSDSSHHSLTIAQIRAWAQHQMPGVGENDSDDADSDDDDDSEDDVGDSSDDESDDESDDKDDSEDDADDDDDD